MHIATRLFPNPEVAAAITDYATTHSTDLGEVVNQHYKDTVEFSKREGFSPRFMISPNQAQFMVFLAKLHRVKRVLEIGCFTGYSALALARAVEAYPDGEVVTLDLEYPATEFARQTFARTGTDKSITLLSGPASSTIQSLTGKFDLIFIDANKDGYVGYLEQILSRSLLAPHGIVLADNTLYHGLLGRGEGNPAAEDPVLVQRAEQIDAFNRFVRERGDLENVLLPAWDGLNLIRFKEGKEG